MFGRMTATVLTRLDAGKDLETAVAELLAIGDYPQIARWIQFPTGVALFLVVPGDPESGPSMCTTVATGCGTGWILMTGNTRATTWPTSTCCSSNATSCGLSKIPAYCATGNGL